MLVAGKTAAVHAGPDRVISLSDPRTDLRHPDQAGLAVRGDSPPTVGRIPGSVPPARPVDGVPVVRLSDRTEVAVRAATLVTSDC
jgi:hypothetical protein